MQENRRLAIRDKHVREKRWDIVAMGLSRLDKLCNNEDLSEFEPLKSLKSEDGLIGTHQKTFDWLDNLHKIAAGEFFHIFSVDLKNKRINHRTTSDPEEVEICEVDMT